MLVLNVPFCAAGQSPAHVRNDTCGAAEQEKVSSAVLEVAVTALRGT